MRDLVVTDLTADPIVQDTALELIVNQRPATTALGVMRLTGWIKRRFLLINEPIERLSPPAWQLHRWKNGQQMFGDCDDVAMLVAAMVSAVGIPVRFVAVRPPALTDFIHVYVEAEYNGAWHNVDTTTGMVAPADWERMVLQL